MAEKEPPRERSGKRPYIKPKLSLHGSLRGLAERVTGLNATP